MHFIEGEEAGDDFGFSVALAGDLNSDGYIDLIVGAPKGDSNSGRVYVFSGKDGDTLFVLNEGSETSRFGNSVASIGDINNDGINDIIVGAPFDRNGVPGAEGTYVFSGKDGDSLHFISGESEFDRFGWSVASAGDVNNDGYPDIIIGASLSATGGINAGRVYVFSGEDWSTLFSYTGESSGDQLGYTVASAGDVNNDGHSDIIVSAIGGALSAGKAYVFSGQNGDILHVFDGEVALDEFGFSVASAGDVNGDGFVDLIVGARLYGDIALRGRVYVFSGKDGSTLHVWTGPGTLDQFGTAVRSAGDINSDGFVDLLIGSPGHDNLGTIGGRVYVFSGIDGDTLYVCDGNPEIIDRVYLLDSDDINGDGYLDIIVGSRNEVHVISLAPDRSCCSTSTGNINGDQDNNVDIEDLTFLIDNLFINFPRLPCPAEGNVDGDPNNAVDISDLTALIDHLFINFLPTAVCK